VKEEVKSFSKMLKGRPKDLPTSERRDEDSFKYLRISSNLSLQAVSDPSLVGYPDAKSGEE